MAFYYFSFDFFWAIFTSVLPPFALTLLILSFLVSADQSDGSREGFGEEKRGRFAGKVEALSDSDEKSADFRATVGGSNGFREKGEEGTENEPIEESPAGGCVGSADNSVGEETGWVQNGEFSFSDDDWEGIERTELERVFAAAVSFVGSARNADRISKLGGDLAAELVGLHKIATVGPCREPQPMAFKPSARAKWNAWKRLGDMDQDIAMELYIELLSRSIPRWLQDHTSEDDKQDRRGMFSVSTNEPIATDWRYSTSLNELKENFLSDKVHPDS